MQLASSIRSLARLGQNDGRLISRDSLMVTLASYVTVLCIIMRFALPIISSTLMNRFGFSLPPYYPLIVTYIALTTSAVVSGTILGFLILDERDEGTLIVMLVTPIHPKLYLFYRILVSWLATTVLIIIY